MMNESKGTKRTLFKSNRGQIVSKWKSMPGYFPVDNACRQF